MRMYPKLSLLSSALLLVGLTACSSFTEVPDITSKLKPYRIDVRQGNFLTQEMVAKLKAGQTKDQVRFILGTPLIEDAFHSERWDYVYRLQPGAGEITERHFAVFFEDGKLVRVSGDVVADSPEATAADQKNAATKPKLIEISGVPTASTSSGESESKWWHLW